MLFHRSSVGFSLGSSLPERRHCYVRAGTFQALLETPGAVELLLDLLGSEEEPPRLERGSRDQQIRLLRQRAIHLAVQPGSPFHGLSIEEILVVSAYTSAWFDKTAWKRDVSRHPDETELNALCREWLRARVAVIRSGQQLGRPHWRLLGYASADYIVPEQLVSAIAPCTSGQMLDADLHQLARDSTFAHEVYLACSPATALDYLQLRAQSGRPLRWDTSVLDRRLRHLGFGLLLVEREDVALCIPARRNSSPPALHEALRLLKWREVIDRGAGEHHD